MTIAAMTIAARKLVASFTRGPRSPTWAAHSDRYKLDRLVLLFFRTDDVRDLVGLVTAPP